MTRFLLRTFVKNHEDVSDPDTRKQIGSLASWTGIVLNILLVIGKGVTGLISGSVSVIADALNNLMDATGSVITLIGFKISSKEADKEHPFGHGRYEYIAGLTVAVLILLVGVELFKSSFNKILNPTPVDYTWVTLGILVISVFLKMWMSHFSNNLGKKINSTALTAVAADGRNDAISTSAVFVTALISRFTSVQLDGWAGIGLAVFIIFNGFTLIKETISPLLGEASSDEFVETMTKKIESYDCILGVHDLIVHDYGPGKQYASAHVELRSDIDPLVSHGVIDQIEKDFLRDDYIHLVIHYDPVEWEYKHLEETE